MATDDAEYGYLKLTAQIVAAHVRNNSISAESVVKLIHDVYNTIAGLAQGDTVSSSSVGFVLPEHENQKKSESPVPFVKPEESVFPEFIICLEDGRKLKTLRRHLGSAYNMTPEQYRIKWNLEANYPMVAPNYSNTRARLAREAQLGGSAQDRSNNKTKKAKRSKL